MQDEFPHWNSLGAQEDGAQSTSSEPSPQSSSLLHTKLREMQRPLAQVNSFGAQVMFPETKHLSDLVALDGERWTFQRRDRKQESRQRSAAPGLTAAFKLSRAWLRHR